MHTLKDQIFDAFRPAIEWPVVHVDDFIDARFSRSAEALERALLSVLLQRKRVMEHRLSDRERAMFGALMDCGIACRVSDSHGMRYFYLKNEGAAKKRSQEMGLEPHDTSLGPINRMFRPIGFLFRG